MWHMPHCRYHLPALAYVSVTACVLWSTTIIFPHCIIIIRTIVGQKTFDVFARKTITQIKHFHGKDTKILIHVKAHLHLYTEKAATLHTSGARAHVFDPEKDSVPLQVCACDDIHTYIHICIHTYIRRKTPCLCRCAFIVIT